MSYWAIILILITISLFLLPLTPAFLELARPTDQAPLSVVRAYDNNPLYFAEGFQNYIAAHFGQLTIGSEKIKSDGRLADGTRYQMIKADDDVALDKNQSTSKLLLFSQPVTLQDHAIFESEVYSESRLATGIGSHFRALMAAESLSIGEDSTVWRWAHSEGDVTVGSNATLYGRITSRKNLILGIGCRFERLHAAKIICGTELLEPPLIAPIERVVLKELNDVKSHAGRRSLLEGDLDFPARHEFDGDIVAGSTAVIGDYAYIKGNIKSNALNDILHYLNRTGVITDKTKGSARCDIGNYVQIDGAIFSTHDLYIGQYCHIMGPVVAENRLVIRSGTVIGSPLHPSTVTAPEIIIESGCVIYGSLFANHQGIVRNALPQNEEIVV